MTSKQFVQTDAGRSKSKRPKQKADCAIRTLAKLLALDYDEAYEMLQGAGRKCNRGFDIEAHFRKNTAWASDGGPDGCTVYFRLHKMPWTKDHHEVGQARRYRISDFLRRHPDGHFAVVTAKHVFAVVNGQVFDDAPWHYLENRPVYAWLELVPVRLPLWRVFAHRKPIKPGGRRMVKRSVAIVEGISYKMAMKTASKMYEWALRPNEDLSVEAYDAD